MNMDMKLIDIFCFLVLFGLLILGAKQRTFLRAGLLKSASLWIAFGGLVLSAFAICLERFIEWDFAQSLVVATYGLSFYAITFHFNPYLRFKLKMPWRTSLRFYLLFTLIGATVFKIGGPQKALYFFAFCSALGVLLWSRYSIVQTIVMIVQLLTSATIIFFLKENQLLWMAVSAWAGHAIIFWLGPFEQRESSYDEKN